MPRQQLVQCYFCRTNTNCGEVECAAKTDSQHSIILLVYCNHWLVEKCSSIVNTWLFYFTNTQFSGWLVNIFHVVALPRHIVRHAADDVVVLERLLDHLLPLPPHLQNSLEWVQAVNLASACFSRTGVTMENTLTSWFR